MKALFKDSFNTILKAHGAYKMYYSSLHPRHQMYMDMGLYVGAITIICLAWTLS